MFTKPAFLLMILSIIYSGLSQAYFAGNFTKLVVESKNVGYVMACFGGVDAVASVIIGRALDRFGRRAILFFSTFFVLVTTGIICLVDQTYFANHLWLPLICAACAGISDAGYNTLLTATTGALFEDDPENAFGGTSFRSSMGHKPIFFLASEFEAAHPQSSLDLPNHLIFAHFASFQTPLILSTALVTYHF